MKKKYIISDLCGGFYDRRVEEFRGILFATKFDTESEAEAAIATPAIPKGGMYEIKYVWVKE